MAKTKEKDALAIPYAMDRRTGRIVLLQASGIIQPDTEFYNAATHKGHLTCPKCETPDVVARQARLTSGDTKHRRDHFARYRDQPHDDSCEWELLEEPTPTSSPRTIDYNKGGYVYLNTGKLPNRPPYRDIFKRASFRIPDGLQLLPAWVQKIAHEKNPHGYDSIANDDFRNRPRLKAISSVRDFLNLMRRIPLQSHKDTWVINKNAAVRLDRLVLRIGTTEMVRKEEDIASHRKTAGLRPSFLMAANPNYDRFAALLDTERDRIKHPVLLHFMVKEPPRKITQDGETFWRVRLAPYDIENPERKKPHPHELALPFVKVHPIVNIYDEGVAKSLATEQEFFALAHPNLSVAGQDSPNRTYYQHFNILRASDIIQMTQQELADAIKKAHTAREARAQRKAAKETTREAAPA